MTNQLKETKDFLESKLAGFKPDLAVIAGSGLGGLTEALANPVRIPYAEVPHFPTPTVAGHAGQIVAGTLANKKVLVCSGRVHVYEGRSLHEVTYAVQAIDALGIKTLLITNAAGAINPCFNPGDLMVIEDHINRMGVNPLIGFSNGNGAPKFVDMTQAYSARLTERLIAAAAKLQIPLRRGVYLATSGPSYETPAEIKAFAWWGADAVGMSTVPEVIMARYHNLEVAGISCITNLAAGIGSKRLNHEEVLATGRAVQDKLGRLITEFIAGV